MSTSLETIPDELKLEIFQYLPSRLNLDLTSRHLFWITPGDLVRRAKTPDSVAEAIRAIRYMILFSEERVSDGLNILFDKFLIRVSDYVIYFLQHGSFKEAKAMLQAWEQLPLQEHIPAEHLLKVLKQLDISLLRRSKMKISERQKTTLEIMKQQPCTSIMPKDFCLAPLNQIKEWIIRIIRDGTNRYEHLRKAKEALQFIKKIPAEAKVPKNFFLDVVKTGRDIILQAFREEQLRFGSLYVADGVARIIMLFNMIIPENYFLEIIKRGQDIICQAAEIPTRELTRGIL